MKGTLTPSPPSSRSPTGRPHARIDVTIDLATKITELDAFLADPDHGAAFGGSVSSPQLGG